ncbi:hypothetical protein O6H91_01G018700 [Diphasiastrum complanatum]|nr:hypothetical protein O6H91_01G018700 [Diphasiastrum complanatum]
MALAAVDMSLDQIIKSNNGKPHGEANEANGGHSRGRGTGSRGTGVNRGYARSKPSGGQIIWRPTRKIDTDTDAPLPEAKPKESNASAVVHPLPAVYARKSVHPLAELFVKSIKVPPNEGVERSIISTPARPARDGTWQHDKFDDGISTVGKAAGIETGIKLYISNLEYGVSNEDVKELFSEVGELKHCSINYDRIGRSKGTAEVVYTKKEDAISAIKRYNSVQLDGKPMKIEVIGTSISEELSTRSGGSNLTYKGGFGVCIASKRGPVGLGHKRISREHGRGRGRGRGGATSKKRAEDLDADLDNYHADIM